MPEVGSIFVKVEGDTSGLDRALTQAERQTQQTAQELGRFSTSARRAGQSSASFGNSTGRTNQALFELARGLEDAQYGLRGVQNNIQQMAIAAGAGGPLVLGITAATLAVSLFQDEIVALVGPLVGVRREFEDTGKSIKDFGEAADDALEKLLDIELDNVLGQFEIRTMDDFKLALASVNLQFNEAKSDADAAALALKNFGLNSGIAAGQAGQLADQFGVTADAIDKAFLERQLGDAQRRLENARATLRFLEEQRDEFEQMAGIVEVLEDLDGLRKKSGEDILTTTQLAVMAAKEQLETTRSFAGLVRDLASDMEDFSGVELIDNRVTTQSARILEEMLGKVGGTFTRVGEKVQTFDQLIQDMARDGDENIRRLADTLGDDLGKGIDTSNKAVVEFADFTRDALGEMVAQLVLAREEFENLGDVARATLRAIAAQGIELAVSRGLEGIFAAQKQSGGGTNTSQLFQGLSLLSSFSGGGGGGGGAATAAAGGSTGGGAAFAGIGAGPAAAITVAALATAELVRRQDTRLEKLVAAISPGAILGRGLFNRITGGDETPLFQRFDPLPRYSQLGLSRAQIDSLALIGWNPPGNPYGAGGAPGMTALDRFGGVPQLSVTPRVTVDAGELVVMLDTELKESGRGGIIP